MSKKPLFTPLSLINTYILKLLDSKDPLSNHDVYKFKDVPLLRGKLKNYVTINNKKMLNGYNITNSAINLSPFDILHLKPNKVQLELLKLNFNNGSYLFNISCGGGKTLVSVELIHRLKLKTLIISARSAVNDQWLNTLKKVYPTLNICSRIDASKKKDNLDQIDIYIVTPQYLSKFVEDFKSQSSMNILKNYKFDFIIYDEIHSLLSDKYSNVLILPFVLKFMKVINYLPLMLGLTASLPAQSTQEYKLLNTIFGKPITLSSEITKIPVDYVDFRDLKTEQERKKFDVNYVPLTSEQALMKSLEFMNEQQIKPSIEFKLIIITHTIDESMYAAMTACSWFNIPTLLIRSVDESDYFIMPDKIPDEYQEMESINPEDRLECTLDTAKELNFMIECKYTDYLNQTGIIVGTDARLKEGFNCENICFGICTKFIYSDVSRVQILGRIRRSSKSEKLNNHSRLFIVNSGRIKSNLKEPGRIRMKAPIKITYDVKREKELFDAENYIKKDIKTYKYKEYIINNTNVMRNSNNVSSNNVTITNNTNIMRNNNNVSNNNDIITNNNNTNIMRSNNNDNNIININSIDISNLDLY